jgi:hypothetical protein
MKPKLDLLDLSGARICICWGLLVASLPFLATFFLDLVSGLLATVFHQTHVELSGVFWGAILLSGFMFVPFGLGLAVVGVIGLFQK